MKITLLILFLIVFQRISIGQDIAREFFSRFGFQELDSTKYELYLAKCDSVLENTPNDFSSRFSKALILDCQGKFSQSREQYELIILIDSTNSAIYYNLAATYINEFKEFLYVTKYSNRDFSNSSAYWECIGNEKGCLEIAQKIYPLLQKSVLFDKESSEVDLEFFKNMESTLRDYIQKTK